MKRKETPATLLLFLIQPFLGFILAIKDLRRRTNAIVFVLFSSLWGYCMTFTFPPSDCYRIAAVFCHLKYRSFEHVLQRYDDGKLVDFYLATMNWLIHKFSNNAKVFFCGLAFVFGLCCLATLREVLLSRKYSNDQYLKCIVLLLFCTASFGHLAMPRFWTAAWLSAFVTIKLMNNLVFYDENIERNLNLTNGLIMAERLMAELTRAGMGKQTAYGIVRKNAIKANKEKLLLGELILEDEEVQKYLTEADVEKIMDPHTYTGSIEIIIDELLEDSKNWF